MIMIRADANEHIGAGHLMRCLSIAHAFAEHGEEVLFISADHCGDELIEKQGFRNICLASKWNAMEEELPIFKMVLAEHNPSLLLVDSYYVTEQYMTELRRITQTAYIDDVNVRAYDTDFLINYNIYADSLDYSQYSNRGTTTLLGPKYAPLRTEFKNIQRHIINKEIGNVFVSTGGSDPEHITERLLKELCPLWPDVQFHFIIGSLNPRINDIKRHVSNNTVLHINETRMSDVMSSCDVAVSAAGTTLYELCACGTPTILYILADNQIDAAEGFAAKRIMLSAGDSRIDPSFGYTVGKLLRSLNQNKRCELSRNMRRLIDGKGAERIVNRLTMKATIAHCTVTN